MQVFDTHFHIIDLRFRVQENQGFFPPSFPAPDYQERTKGLGISGGNVVSGSFQGFDTVFMHEALRDNIGTANVRKVFFDNAVKFYRPCQMPVYNE